MTFVGVVATVAVAMTIIQFLPQPFRVFRTGTAGVSTATWVLLLCTQGGWFAFGVARSLTALWVTAVITLPAAAAVCVKLAGRSVADRRLVSAAVAWLAAVIVAVQVAPAAVGVSLAVVDVVATVPQLRLARRGGDLSGVSRLGWFATFVAQTLWGVYGVLVSEPVVAFAGFAFAVLAGCVVVLVSRNGTLTTPQM